MLVHNGNEERKRPYTRSGCMHLVAWMVSRVGKEKVAPAYNNLFFCIRFTDRYGARNLERDAVSVLLQILSIYLILFHQEVQVLENILAASSFLLNVELL